MVSPVRGYLRRYQAETPLIGLFKLRGQLLTLFIVKTDKNVFSVNDGLITHHRYFLGHSRRGLIAQ
jgi:hypothetical protein